ncbi:MAG: type II toxin-antitoxin system antitoxin SocA domain-containing protein [Sarcina sp.]
MNSKKVFCEICRDDVLYIEKKEKLSTKIKGEIYEYDGVSAVCSKCNSEVFVSELIDQNLKILYERIREKNKIISLKNILEISGKYNIGKRPFSLLMGWGEQTFSRYCDGDMPTNQYSVILEKVYNDPNYYLEILEENKDRVTLKTYQKSKEKTNAMLVEVKNLENSKLNEVAQYLLFECEDITHLALQKMLYYVQGFSYVFTNKFIFKEDCEAWLHGPVFKDIYLKYKEYRFDPIKATSLTNNIELEVSEKAIIDSVIKNLGCYSGKILESFTHEEKPWRESRKGIPVTMYSNKIIEKDLIKEYFISIKEKNKMINPLDISDYTKKMFEQISN